MPLRPPSHRIARALAIGLISETQHSRLRIILRALDEGRTQHDIAAELGVTRTTVTHIQKRLVGTYRWPPDRNDILHLLALEVVSDAEILSRIAKRRPPIVSGGAKAPHPPQRQERIGGGDPRLSFEEIAERREAARNDRLAHERKHLAAERQRYGLPARGRALSEMAI